jgi:MFS transporter, ACS family, solute carrier family 17 (sodium-dependent inorganic phosphate cotransporter), other
MVWYHLQLPGGYLAARLGAKRVLLGGVIIWTLFDLSTILVSSNFTPLFIARIGMGLGEGILFPCMHQIAGAWYPLQERSRLVAIISSGSDVGTVLAMVVSPALMASFGWPVIFQFFGVLSFCWVFTYYVYGESLPEHDPRISPEERAFILANRSSAATAKGYAMIGSGSGQQQQRPRQVDAINLKLLLTSRAAWAVYVAHFCQNYGWYVLLGWIPQYFRQVLHIDLGAKGFTAALPYLCGYMGVVSFGRIGDMAVARGVRVLRVRQAINAFGFLGSALFLYLMRYAHNAPTAIAMLCCALFLTRSAVSGFWVNMIDIGPRHAAHVMAVSNSFATIPGVIGNVVTGRILAATNDWNFVFAIAASVLAFGAVFFHCNASDQSIYETDARKHGGGNGEVSPGSFATNTTMLSTPRQEEMGLLDEY